MVRTRARVAAESARAAAVRARAATAAVLESPDLLAVVIKQIAAQEHGWAAALWRVGAVSTLWRTVVHSVRFDLEEWTEWRWTIPDARKKLFKPPATVAEALSLTGAAAQAVGADQPVHRLTRLESQIFRSSCGAHAWRLVLTIPTDEQKEMGLFLCVANPDDLPAGWARITQFELGLRRGADAGSSSRLRESHEEMFDEHLWKRDRTTHRFDADCHDWGFASFYSRSALPACLHGDELEVRRPRRLRTPYHEALRCTYHCSRPLAQVAVKLRVRNGRIWCRPGARRPAPSHTLVLADSFKVYG